MWNLKNSLTAHMVLWVLTLRLSPGAAMNSIRRILPELDLDVESIPAEILNKIT